MELTTTAKYDLMGAGLTKDDICDEIVEWIDNNERVKKVLLKGQHAGQVAYEMKTASIRPWRRGATHQASRRSVAAKPLGRTSAGTATIATLPLSSAACEHSNRGRPAQVRATTAP